MLQVGAACYRWVWHAAGGCGMLQVGVAYYRWVWHTTGGCGMLQVGVAYYRWVWHAAGGCGMLQVGVACCRWVWHTHQVFYFKEVGCTTSISVELQPTADSRHSHERDTCKATEEMLLFEVNSFKQFLILHAPYPNLPHKHVPRVGVVQNQATYTHSTRALPASPSFCPQSHLALSLQH